MQVQVHVLLPSFYAGFHIRFYHLYAKQHVRYLTQPCLTVVVNYISVAAGGREQAGAQISGEIPSPLSLMPASTAGAPLVHEDTTSRGQEKGPSPLSSPPSTAAFLNKVAAQIPAKWKLFAYNINIEDDALAEIELKYLHNPTECFMNIFRAWKKNLSPPFTWETVIEVLQSPAVGEKKMAEDIKQSHDL